MDDIKESVRSAAFVLVRTVRSLTLRLCDRELTPTTDVQQCVAVALPLLLEKGMGSSVGEVRRRNKRGTLGHILGMMDRKFCLYLAHRSILSAADAR
jgi:hypothetical protein